MKKNWQLTLAVLTPFTITPMALIISCANNNSNTAAESGNNGTNSGSTGQTGNSSGNNGNNVSDNNQFVQGKKPTYEETFKDDLPTQKPQSPVGPEKPEPKPTSDQVLTQSGGTVNGLEATSFANVVKQLELLPSTKIDDLTDDVLSKTLGISGMKVQILEGDTLKGTLKLKLVKTKKTNLVLAQAANQPAEQVVEISGFNPIFHNKYQYSNFKLNPSAWVYNLLDMVDHNGNFNADEAWKRIQFLSSDQWNDLIDDATIEVVKPNESTNNKLEKKSWASVIRDHKFKVFADKMIPAQKNEPAKISLKISANAPFTAMRYDLKSKKWVPQMNGKDPVRVDNGFVLQTGEALVLPLKASLAAEGVLNRTQVFEPYFNDLYPSALATTILQKVKKTPGAFINNMIFNDLVFGGRAKEVAKKYFNNQSISFVYYQPEKLLFADDFYDTFRFGIQIAIGGKIQTKNEGPSPLVKNLEVVDKTKSLNVLKQQLTNTTTQLQLKKDSLIRKNIIKLLKDNAALKTEIDKGLAGQTINLKDKEVTTATSNMNKHFVLTNNLNKTPLYNNNLLNPQNKEQNQKSLQLWANEFDLKFLNNPLVLDYEVDPNNLKPAKGHLNFETGLYNLDEQNIFTVNSIFFELYSGAEPKEKLPLQISSNNKVIGVNFKVQFLAGLGNSTIGPLMLPLDVSFTFDQADWK